VLVQFLRVVYSALSMCASMQIRDFPRLLLNKKHILRRDCRGYLGFGKKNYWRGSLVYYCIKPREVLDHRVHQYFYHVRRERKNTLIDPSLPTDNTPSGYCCIIYSLRSSLTGVHAFIPDTETWLVVSAWYLSQH
jgi:hypothetical protein